MPAMTAPPVRPAHQNTLPPAVWHRAAAALTVAGLTGAVAGYLVLRRGYLDLYILNKSLATTSLATLGLVLLIGPFSRYFQRFDFLVAYRKFFGLGAFWAAVLHVVLSLFFLPEHFKLSRFFGQVNIPFYFGLAATAVLLVLYALSYDRLIGRMDRRRWWHVHNWGVRVATLLGLLHLVLMKYPGWLKWWAQGGSSELVRQYLPPASLVGALFLAFVVGVRFSELAGPRRGARLTQALAVVWVVATLGLFVRGAGLSPIQKTPTAEECAKFSAAARAVRCP